MSVPLDTTERTGSCSPKYSCTLFDGTVPFVVFEKIKDHNPLIKNPPYFQPLRFGNQDVSWSSHAEIVGALNKKTLTSY